MKKALVFGGSGFLGSHIADALSQQGFCTTIFDINPSPYLSGDQAFIQDDVLNQGAVEKAVQDADIVYHLAGQPSIPESLKQPAHTLHLNIQGTVNILEACVKHNIERFLFASTVYIYSDVGGFYRASKQACEIIIQEYQKNYDLDYTILRYGSLYGPRAVENNFINRLLKQAVTKRKIEIDFDEEDKREYIHVHDAARMSVLSLQDDYKNTSVMLTGYQYMTCKELIDLINDMLGGDLTFEHIEKDNNRLQAHYHKTPYIFKPQISKKIIAPDYIEFGQGLLASIEEIYANQVRENDTEEDIMNKKQVKI